MTSETRDAEIERVPLGYHAFAARGAHDARTGQLRETSHLVTGMASAEPRPDHERLVREQLEAPFDRALVRDGGRERSDAGPSPLGALRGLERERQADVRREARRL